LCAVAQLQEFLLRQKPALTASTCNGFDSGFGVGLMQTFLKLAFGLLAPMLGSHGEPPNLQMR